MFALMKIIVAVFFIFAIVAEASAGNFSNTAPEPKTTNELGCKQIRPAKLFGKCYEIYEVNTFPDVLQCSSGEPSWADNFFLKQGNAIAHKRRATEPKDVVEAGVLVKLETKSADKIVLAHHVVSDGDKWQTNFEFTKRGQLFHLLMKTSQEEHSLTCKPVDLMGLSVDEYGTCLGVTKYRETDYWFHWKDEEQKWGLTCGSNIKMAKRFAAEDQQSISTNMPAANQVASNATKKDTQISNNSFANKKAKSNINPNQTCVNLNNKILSHIEKEEYTQAKAAKELMNEFNCKDDMILAGETEQRTNKPTYSAADLKCFIGPLGKFIFGTYGEYYAESYEKHPPKNCTTTYQYCKARAKSISDGARIKPSERSQNQTSYSAYCNSNSLGAGLRTNCDIYSNSNSGGFSAGLADGLAKGIEVAAAKKQIYVSNFEICMADMGYNLTEN